MGIKINDLASLAEAPATNDLFVIVDVSDTTQDATGTTKKIESQYVTIADASTTVKGKVELATDAETITGTDTGRAITPSNLTGKMDTDGTLAGNSDTRIPSQKAVKTYVDTVSASIGDWKAISATITFSSADAPTYVCTTSSDLTGIIGVGMRIKLTHSSTPKYFIVTAIAAGTITLYGGTDYTLAATAITSPFFSSVKSPLGFPQDPTKWTVSVISDTTERAQASPVQDTVYNLGSLTGNIPIGAWSVEWKLGAYIAGGTNPRMQVSLSTANNSFSDSGFTKGFGADGTGADNSLYCRKTLVLAAKTAYYLVAKCTNTSATTIRIAPSNGGDAESTVVNATCAYL